MPFAAQASGHVDAWSRLPASVQRVFVIRDNPLMRMTTFDLRGPSDEAAPCARHGCSIPLRTALPPDPAATAVA